jgi:hypothetical protein
MLWSIRRGEGAHPAKPNSGTPFGRARLADPPLDQLGRSIE